MRYWLKWAKFYCQSTNTERHCSEGRTFRPLLAASQCIAHEQSLSFSVCVLVFLSFLFFFFLMRPCCSRTRCRVSFTGTRGASTCITNEARSMLHAAIARVTDPIVKSISCRTRSSLAALRTSQVKSYYSCSSIKADRRIIANGLSF